MIAKFKSHHLKNTITFEHINKSETYPNHIGIIIEDIDKPTEDYKSVALSDKDLFSLIGYLLTIQKEMKEVSNG